jgi:penicillin amidase
VLPGLIPIRAGATDGDRVRDGASGANEWTGYVPRDQLPWQLDPKAGQVVSANNAPVDAQYPSFLGDDWDPGYRATRVGQLLEQVPGKLTVDDMASIEADTKVLRADAMIPALLALNPKPGSAEGQVLLDRIRGWDHMCDADSYGCAAYMASRSRSSGRSSTTTWGRSRATTWARPSRGRR